MASAHVSDKSPSNASSIRIRAPQVRSVTQSELELPDLPCISSAVPGASPVRLGIASLHSHSGLAGVLRASEEPESRDDVVRAH